MSAKAVPPGTRATPVARKAPIPGPAEAAHVGRSRHGVTPAGQPGADPDALRTAREERRRRREERRARQRAQNVVRAASMHEARVAYEASGKAAAVRPAPPRAVERQQLFIGCSGWFYWHWRDDFYPRALPTSGWFEHYLKHFRTVELNAPFYSWPTVATVQGWVRQYGNGSRGKRRDRMFEELRKRDLLLGTLARAIFPHDAVLPQPAGVWERD